MKKNLSLKNKMALLFVLAAIVILYPIVLRGDSYYMSVAIEIAIFAIYAISYDLLLGYTGIVSFGHAVFFGFGAYITAILMVRSGWSFLSTLPIVVIVCVALGFIIGFLTLRVKSTYFSMMTLALGQMFFVIASKAKDLTGGDDGLPGVPPIIRNKVVMYFAAVAILVLVYYLVKRITLSPLGRVLQAIRENETRTDMIGYNVLSYKLVIICITGVLAGLAGSLYTTYLGVAYPALIHSDMTMQAIFMTIIGGTGTLYGPIIGSIIVKLANTALSTITQRWMLIFGILFIFCVMVLPGGIASLFTGRRKKNDL